jgi:hypothetical protein
MRSAQAKFCLLLLVGALANSANAQEIGTSSSSVGQDVVIDKPAAAPTKVPTQILRGLGRKAGAGAGPTDRAINDPTLLPDCIPANGVVCSDRDYTGLLDVNPAVPDLALDKQYAFAGFEPSLEVSTGDETKVRPDLDPLLLSSIQEGKCAQGFEALAINCQWSHPKPCLVELCLVAGYIV